MDLIYGRQSVLEALRAGLAIQRLRLAAGVRPRGPIAAIIQLAQERGLPIEYVDRRLLDRLTGGANHQGVVAEVPPFAYAPLEAIFRRLQASPEPGLVLVLDHLQDPQNFGTLLRTADAVGVHGVILPRHRSVGVTPAVVKASAGAVLYLSVALVTNLVQTLEELKTRGLWTVGLEGSAPQSYETVDVGLPLAVVVGSEGTGLSRLVRETCDLLVRLPMRGHVSSLNAAVAGSLMLYHIWRERVRRGLVPPEG